MVQNSEQSTDYTQHPDFNSQDYYNWLALFTKSSREKTLPLSFEDYSSILRVYQAVMLNLGSPTGILLNSKNYRTLRDISYQLNSICSNHVDHTFSIFKL